MLTSTPLTSIRTARMRTFMAIVLARLIRVSISPGARDNSGEIVLVNWVRVRSIFNGDCASLYANALGQCAERYSTRLNFGGGQEVNDPELDKLEMRKKVGMEFQQFNLFPQQSVEFCNGIGLMRVVTAKL